MINLQPRNMTTLEENLHSYEPHPVSFEPTTSSIGVGCSVHYATQADGERQGQLLLSSIDQISKPRPLKGASPGGKTREIM